MKILRAQKSSEARDQLYSLACGLDRRVKRYSGCIINGMRFHTKERERHRKTQNSGIVVKGEHQGKDIDFYGILTDILELDYMGGNRVFLFKCDWWDVSNNKAGIHVDEYFTSVNMARKWYKDDPFILASQAEQVFYVHDTKLNGNRHVVQKTPLRNVYDVLEIDTEEGERDQVNTEAFQQSMTNDVNEVICEELLNVSLNRNDMVPNYIDADTFSPINANQDDNDFTDDDELDGEDDTLEEYNSDQEEVVKSDEDTDIDDV